MPNVGVCIILLITAFGITVIETRSPPIRVVRPSEQKIEHSSLIPSLIVFGDSISDDGFDMMGDEHGFKRFCAGPTWAEYVGKKLGTQIKNYAYSGAHSDYSNFYTYDWSGSLWQVERYLEEHSGRVEDGTVIVMQTMGINDFWSGENNASEIAGNLYKALSKLAKGGAKHILAFNIINFAPVPGVREHPDAQREMTEFVRFTNKLIAHKMETIKIDFPETKFYSLDVESLFTDAENDGQLLMEIFDHHDPNTKPGHNFKYAFFDAYHPSTVLQYQIAIGAMKSLGLN